MSDAAPPIGRTLGDALDAATGLLGAAVPEPRREALRLAADLFGRSAGSLLLDRDGAVGSREAARLAAAAARRAGGEPAAYVTGVAGFRSLTLAADPRALIPRPETEGLVDRVLDRAPGGVAVDVGTGSGCIALSLAAEGAYRLVIGIDRCRDALSLARENADRTGLPLALLRADLVAALPARSADVLVSNPPYVSESEYAALDPSVRAYEPAAALVSGADGLRHTLRLLADGLAVVRPGGWIALELAADRAAAAGRAARDAGWTDVTIEDDLFGRPRYLLARRRA